MSEILLGAAYGALAGGLLAWPYRRALAARDHYRLWWGLLFGVLWLYSFFGLGVIGERLSGSTTPTPALVFSYLVGIVIAFRMLQPSTWHLWRRTLTHVESPGLTRLALGDLIASLLGAVGVLSLVLVLVHPGEWRGSAVFVPVVAVVGPLLALSGFIAGHMAWLTVVWMLWPEAVLQGEVDRLQFLRTASRWFISCLASLRPSPRTGHD
ncbi:MAG TPA: hypothetical protein VI485_03925 [Vicinamibacterales bacterium]|nr:hypothetical protein [Vicinamibacterales bacterium]